MKTPVFTRPVLPQLRSLPGLRPSVQPTRERVRVVVVDQESGVRTLLQRILNLCLGFACAGAHASALAALADACRQHPRIMLLDIRMPGTDGIESIRRLNTRLPHVPVIVLTAATSAAEVWGSLFAGAAGYLIKPCSVAAFLSALSEAVAGGVPLCAATRSILVKSLHHRVGHLAPRQCEVMAGLLAGQDVKGIAIAQQRTVRAIQTCIYRLCRKFHSHSAHDLAEQFLRGTGPD